MQRGVGTLENERTDWQDQSSELVSSTVPCKMSLAAPRAVKLAVVNQSWHMILQSKA